MDIQIIALWIGLFITFVLGLVNFLWGPAILARREKVIIRKPKLNVSVEEGDWIDIRSSFKLVRTRGEQDLYLESAYLRLSKAMCKELEPYCEISSKGRIYWSEPSREPGFDKGEHKRLKINEPKEFKIFHGIQFGVFTEPDGEQSFILTGYRSMLRKLKEKVRKLEPKYEIVWIDAKGRKWRYRLPQKWWNKFLPERLWWRIV